MTADFRINSRLLVQNPPERNDRAIDEEMLDVYKPGWYVWRNDRFYKLPIKIKYKKGSDIVEIDDSAVPANAVRKQEKELLAAATHRPMAEYPVLARATQVRGRVVVQVVIDEQGNVINAQVRYGHPLLREAAKAAARDWKFKPFELDGVRVAVVGDLTFNFELTKK